jgi:hypothetical protein
VALTGPGVAAAATEALAAVVGRAVTGGDDDVEVARRLLELLREAGISVGIDAAQEQVYDVLLAGRTGALVELGRDLGLAVDGLGVPAPAPDPAAATNR